MKAESEQVRAELEILSVDGLIKPEAVVAFARNPETALHGHFTWDDGEAASRWRIEEARRLIRVFVMVEPREQKGPVRAFVSLPSDRRAGGGYRALSAVLSDKERRQELLQAALDDLRVFQKRYQVLRELEDVMRAAAQAEARYGAVEKSAAVG